MAKTILLKFLLAVVITFILILPEYFKAPNGNTLELSCLEVCLQSNFTSSLPLNISFVAFLPSARETQTVLRLFLNHSNFQNFTRICQDISREFKMCSSCLVCESQGNTDFISKEKTSKVLVMKGLMEEKANDFYSPCQHFNFTVPPLVDSLEEYNFSCNAKNHTRPEIMEEDSSKEKSTNTCRITEHLNNCVHISLYLEMSVRTITCSMKITWYVLVLLVFVALLILIVHKVLEDLRRTQKWQSHKYKSTSVFLRESDSEKLRTLNVRVISDTARRLPLIQVKGVLPQIPELEVTSVEL
ncbi:transmembrane protein 156 isoform X1 [Erinaceus europaeus]|uniref:Transmembrane protein 156 n=1 Tax=Erinaceus europaeus TaxID=9365 RepID=A0A1S2ZQ98_ERIEU|nr:transmembrane protein 156 isoform X1 [Erinaceus europaeus]XP_060044195.1 transmembrane protein 156 isoform X1 [Erinaceus europaeus]